MAAAAAVAGDDVGPGLSSGSVVNGCDWASSKRAHPDATSNAAHSSGQHTPHRPALSHAGQVTDCPAERATRPFRAAFQPRQYGAESAAPILDSRVTSIYPEQRDQSPPGPTRLATARRPGPPGSASLVDPEDDLPSSTYAGDFETTAIPRYDSDKSATDQPGFGLIGEPEPLPYVQPGGRARGRVLLGRTGRNRDRSSRPTTGHGSAGRRGTQDLGLLLLRVGFGVLLIAHGLQKAFGWWGGRARRLPGIADRDGLPACRHPDLRGRPVRSPPACCWYWGFFTPLAAAGALAYLLNGVLAEAMAAQEEPG